MSYDLQIVAWKIYYRNLMREGILEYRYFRTRQLIEKRACLGNKLFFYT